MRQYNLKLFWLEADKNIKYHKLQAQLKAIIFNKFNIAWIISTKSIVIWPPLNPYHQFPLYEMPPFPQC